MRERVVTTFYTNNNKIIYIHQHTKKRKGVHYLTHTHTYGNKAKGEKKYLRQKTIIKHIDICALNLLL